MRLLAVGVWVFLVAYLTTFVVATRAWEGEYDWTWLPDWIPGIEHEPSTP